MAGIDESLIKNQLVGTDEATIDEKGRVVFTKKKRERLGDTFVMALSDLGCVWVLPKTTWSQMLTEIAESDATNQGRQQYARLLLGDAEDDLKFDVQRRVVIPRKLRDKAKLVDGCGVVMVGVGDRVEIWNKDQYDEYQKDPDHYNMERRETVARAYRQMMGKD